MSLDSNDKKLEALALEVELPDSAYEKAVDRFKDLGAWIGRQESRLHGFDPHVFPQGSFALGTAITPPDRGENYDLDLSCNLRSGVTRQTHTQKELKHLLELELDAYRQGRNIQEPLEEKNRCWRLHYQGHPGFHMDTVPGIPTEAARRNELRKLMENRLTMDTALATTVANESMWITDRTSPSYAAISQDWGASNPSGYLKWFHSRMVGLEEQLAEDAKVTAVPEYKRKTALQRAIQILKAHRDRMFLKAPDSKPISVIITTLAARAYRPTHSLTEALTTILGELNAFRLSGSSEILNPTNPAENFADKWIHPDYNEHDLKRSFHIWVEQVTTDLREYLVADSEQRLIAEANERFGVTPDATLIRAALGSIPLVASAEQRPRRVEILRDSPRPHRCN
jgi:hypothetical protein